MICYVVIDTNVLVSALLSKSDDVATVQLLGHLLKGKIVPVYSEEIIKEYWEVLCRKKFKFSKHMIKLLLTAIQQYDILKCL